MTARHANPWPNLLTVSTIENFMLLMYSSGRYFVSDNKSVRSITAQLAAALNSGYCNRPAAAVPYGKQSLMLTACGAACGTAPRRSAPNRKWRVRKFRASCSSRRPDARRAEFHSGRHAYCPVSMDESSLMIRGPSPRRISVSVIYRPPLQKPLNLGSWPIVLYRTCLIEHAESGRIAAKSHVILRSAAD